jgi:hypothetical protein
MLVGAGLVVWALLAERLGWHGPTRLFLSGVRSGLKSGESCCGPSVFSDICRRPDDKRR